MAKSTTEKSPSRAFRALASLLLVGVFVTVGLFVYYVLSRRTELEAQQARHLEVVARHMEQTFEGYAQSLEEIQALAKEMVATKRHLLPEDFCKKLDLVHNLQLAGKSCVPDKAERRFRPFSENGVVEWEAQENALRIEIEAPPATEAAKIGPVVFVADLRKALEQILLPDVFDQTLLVHDNTVVVTEGKPGYRIHDLDGFRAEVDDADEDDPTLQGSRAQLMANATTKFNVQLRGERHLLLCQPLKAAHFPEDLGSATTQNLGSWAICGLQSQRVHNSRLFEISPYWLLGLLGFLFVGLLSLPFLKLRYLAPNERLSLTDVILLGLALLMGSGLATLAAMAVWVHVETRDGLDDKLVAMANQIASHVKYEQTSMYEQLSLFEELLDAGSLQGTKESPDGQQAIASLLNENGRSYRAAVNGHLDWSFGPYPHFGTFHGICPDGTQAVKWVTWPTNTRFRSIPSRDYYRRPRDGRLWSLSLDEGKSRNGEFFFEPIRSYSTGDLIVVLSKPYSNKMEASVLGTLCEVIWNRSGNKLRNQGSPVVALTGWFHSLRDVVLPPSFGFAIVDVAGNVKFHSQRQRALVENLVYETGDDPRLRRALETGISDTLSVDYWGRGHRLRVLPLEGMPWFVVVFGEKVPIQVAHFSVLLGAITFFTCYLLLFFVLPALAYVAAFRRLPRSLWPDRTLHEGFAGTYELLAVVVALVGVIAVVAPFCLGPEAGSDLALFLPLLAALLAFRMVRWNRRLQGAGRRTPAWSWLAVGIGLVIAVVILRSLWLTAGWAAVVFLFILAAVVSLTLVGVAHYFPVPHRSFRKAYLLAASSLIFTLAVVPAVSFYMLAHQQEMGRLAEGNHVALLDALHHQAEVVRDRYQGRHGTELGRTLADSVLRRFWGVYGKELHSTKVDGDGETIIFRLPQSQAAQKTGDSPAGTRNALNTKSLSARTYVEISRALPLQEIPGLPQVGAGNVPRQFGDDLTVSYREQGREIVVTSEGSGGGSNTLIGRVPQPYSFAGDGLDTPRPWIRLLGLFLVVIVIFLALTCWALRRVFLLDLLPSPTVDWQEELALEDGESWFLVGVLTDRERDRLDKLDTGWLTFRQLLELSEADLQQRLVALAKAHSILVLEGFEWNRTDANDNLRKLKILTEFLQRDLRLVVTSTVDPRSVSLSARSDPQEPELSDRLEPSTWTAVFGRFVFEMRDDIDGERDFLQGLFELEAKQTEESLDENASTEDAQRQILRSLSPRFRYLARQCRMSRPLQSLGLRLARHSDQLEDAELKVAMDEQAYGHYRDLWSRCSDAERLTLAHVAREGVVNPKRHAEIRSLLSRGLLVRDPAIRLMNDSFTRFVLETVQPEQLRQWERPKGARSEWLRLQWLSSAVLLMLALFLFLTQRQLFEGTITFLSALALGVPALLKAVSGLNVGLWNEAKG